MLSCLVYTVNKLGLPKFRSVIASICKRFEVNCLNIIACEPNIKIFSNLPSNLKDKRATWWELLVYIVQKNLIQKWIFWKSALPSKMWVNKLRVSLTDVNLDVKYIWLESTDLALPRNEFVFHFFLSLKIQTKKTNTETKEKTENKKNRI